MCAALYVSELSDSLVHYHVCVLYVRQNLSYSLVHYQICVLYVTEFSGTLSSMCALCDRMLVIHWYTIKYVCSMWQNLVINWYTIKSLCARILVIYWYTTKSVCALYAGILVIYWYTTKSVCALCAGILVIYWYTTKSVCALYAWILVIGTCVSKVHFMYCSFPVASDARQLTYVSLLLFLLYYQVCVCRLTVCKQAMCK